MASWAAFCCHQPEARVARRPFQLMFLAQMKREGVTPREDLVADVALILRRPSNLENRHKSEVNREQGTRTMAPRDAAHAETTRPGALS